MKKPLKILGIIVLATAAGFFMTACPADETSSPPPPEKFITVTGIPSIYNSMIGAVKLYPIDDSSNVTVYSTVVKISETSVTLPLYNWVGEDPWSGSGSFKIAIFIFNDKTDAASGKYTYRGVITEISITETTTTIAWAFTQIP